MHRLYTEAGIYLLIFPVANVVRFVLNFRRRRGIISEEHVRHQEAWPFPVRESIGVSCRMEIREFN
jgi:hypothetical protein